MKKIIKSALIIALSAAGLVLIPGCSGGDALEKKIDSKSEDTDLTIKERLEKIRGISGKVEIPVENPTTGTIASVLSVTGELVPQESAVVRPQMSGRLLFERTVKVGDMLEKGTVVAKIDDRDLRDEIEQQKRQIEISRENLLLDEKELAQSRKDLEFDRQMVKEGFLNENDLRKSELAVERAEISLRQSRLRLEQEDNKLEQILRKQEKIPVIAPISGMVVQASYLTGQNASSSFHQEEIMNFQDKEVSTGTDLFGIVSSDAFLARCPLNGKDKARVREGMNAKVTVVTHNMITVPGKLIRIANLQDSQSHAYQSWIRLDEMYDSFNSGLFVRADIELERSDGSIIIDKEYLKEEGGSYFVQTVVNGSVKNVPVKTGISSGDKVQIIEGLSLDDRIIASAKIIAPGQEVKPVEKKEDKKE